jgi:hypothetical protein
MTPPVAGGPAFIGHQLAVRCSVSRDVTSRGPSAVTRRAGPPFQAPLPSWGHQHRGLKAAEALPEGASEGMANIVEDARPSFKDLQLRIDIGLVLYMISNIFQGTDCFGNRESHPDLP